MAAAVPAGDVPVDEPQAVGVVTSIPPTGAEAPVGLTGFTCSPCLTVRVVDPVVGRQDIQGALRGVGHGNENDEEYLLEILGNEDFWQHLDAVEPMEPWEYFETHPPRIQEGESLQDAAKRIVSEALLERVVLDPLLTEMDLEEATWN